MFGYWKGEYKLLLNSTFVHRALNRERHTDMRCEGKKQVECSAMQRKRMRLFIHRSKR